MKRLQFNRDITRKWVGDLRPRIRRKLYYNKEESWKCFILWNGSAGYEVAHYNDTYVVNLENRTCACGYWKLFGIPCCRVICATLIGKNNPKIMFMIGIQRKYI